MKKLVLSLIALTAISGTALAGNTMDNSSAWRNSFGATAGVQNTATTDSNALAIPARDANDARSFMVLKQDGGLEVRDIR